MAGFIYYIYYLQACMFRCGGQRCLEDGAELWEDEVVWGVPRSRKGGVCRLSEARGKNLGAWAPFWLSYSTLLFFSPCPS